jgi:hypothetical protein
MRDDLVNVIARDAEPLRDVVFVMPGAYCVPNRSSIFDTAQAAGRTL